jgi:hypothetical protein
MARFGSEKIRGHGIPEAMEQVLLNQSPLLGGCTAAFLVSCLAMKNPS